MKLSSIFRAGTDIPSKYTCDGENAMTPMTIEDVPANTRSLALIMDDPDIPEFVKQKYGISVFDHWVLFNIPPTTKKIDAGNAPGIPGNNGTGKTGYIGPCPPDRKHRYFYKLFALDCMLSLKEGANKDAVLTAMKGHIIEQTELIGHYERTKK